MAYCGGGSRPSPEDYEREIAAARAVEAMLRAEVERLKAALADMASRYEDVERGYDKEHIQLGLMRFVATSLVETVRKFYNFASGDDIDEHNCLGVCDGCSGRGDCEAGLARELKALETLCKE